MVVCCDLYLLGGFQNIFIGYQTCSGFGIRILGPLCIGFWVLLVFALEKT